MGVVGSNRLDRISESEREIVRGASHGDAHDEVTPELLPAELV